jgi:ketohexokinase
VYPAEDSEVRARAQDRRMGGNAANTAIVLAQLGVLSGWAGNLAPDAALIEWTFDDYRVDTSAATRLSHGVTPTSYVLLSAATGSRSIVHYRDLPEFRAADFERIDLDRFDWVHFEGRAVDELGRMMERARQVSGLSVSLEVEKVRPGIESLFDSADLLLCSHDYARSQGHADAPALLRSLPMGVRATCTWGAHGAWAVDVSGEVIHVAAPRIESVVDTLGAGDLFNAVMIDGVSRGFALTDALERAVKRASAQCACEGLQLKDAASG